MTIAKKGQTKQMYEKNFRFLSPWLKDTVSKLDDQKLREKIEVDYNEEGHPVCRYRQGERSFQVTSQQPLREAETYCAKAAKEASGAIFLFGSGFGYPIFELFAHKKPGTIIVLFEQDLYLFKAMLHYFDFSPIAQTGEIIFLVGSSGYFADAFHFMIRSVALFSCTCPTLVFTPAARSNFKTEYSEIHRYIFEQLTFQSTFIGNDHLDTLIGLRNLTNNLDVILREPYISCLKDRFRDVPAFIIANGPSLDKNIQKIKQIQGRGLVLSVESAIVPLTKNGIVPDILTIIERGRETYTYHLKDRHYDDSITLLCLGLVDKKVFPAFHGPKIPIFRGTEAINQWFNRRLGDGSCIDAGSNVSHLAMELAVYLGANPIVFVGQDFAYSQDGAMTHSRDASYNEEKIKPALDPIKALPPVYLEGNSGELLRSNWLWKDFKVGLEIKIAEHPEKLFLNASEGGAKIAGTVCQPLEDVIQKYCVSPLPCRLDALVRENAARVSLPEREKGLAGLLADTEQYVRLLRSLQREMTRGKLSCINAIRRTRQKDAGTHTAAFDALRKSNAEIFDKFYCDSLVLHFSQQVLISYHYLANRLGKADTPEQFADAFKLQFNYLCYLGFICQSLAVSLETVAEQIEALSDEYDGEKEEALNP